MTSTTSKTFCVLPWIHVSTRTNGDIRVCCVANSSAVSLNHLKTKDNVVRTNDGVPANLNEIDLMQAWNGDYMKNIRLKMIHGEQPESCAKCYKEEALGIQSKRQWELNHWGEKINIQELIDATSKEGWAPESIYYLDLRLGNKCQLACTMCSPHESSGWIKDWNALYPNIKKQEVKQLFDWQNKGKINDQTPYNWYLKNENFKDHLSKTYPFLKQLYFAGGEPLINSFHYQILEDLVELGYSKNITLRYNSNGMEIPEHLFELWDNFKAVKFHFSIDGSERTNPWIRWPSDWKTIERNLWRLDNTKDHIQIVTSTTIMNLNAFDLPRLCKWKLEQGFKKINKWPFSSGLINTHFLYAPNYLSIKTLPNKIKSQVRKQWETEFFPWLEEHWQKSTGVIQNQVDYQQWQSSAYGIKRWRGILDFMDSNDQSKIWPNTIYWLGTSCKYQNKPNWNLFFPEFNQNI
jgi:hypothetical protein